MVIEGSVFTITDKYLLKDPFACLNRIYEAGVSIYLSNLFGSAHAKNGFVRRNRP